MGPGRGGGVGTGPQGPRKCLANSPGKRGGGGGGVPNVGIFS